MIPRVFSAWYALAASAASLSSFVIVFMLAPVRRFTARMLIPSTNIPMICARFSVLSLFISKL